jgi:2-polyprenyl-6-methoxyphenol hydroxylase-like FAD-dependent oxidoreductase
MPFRPLTLLRTTKHYTTMSQSKPKNIVIVGGSLGGLFMGVALKRLRKDLNIRILERNPTPLLHDQGAGVVAGPDVQQFFETYDRTKTPLAVTSHQRLYLSKDGGVIDRENKEQQMTSWDLLYHLLRANFDGVKSEYAKVPEAEEGEGSVSYEYGCSVVGVKVPNSTSGSTQELDMSNPVRITFQDRDGQTTSTDADLVIAAEHVQILAYTIPGKHGIIEPGKRLLNWVWYNNYKEDSPEHIDLMTDNEGKRHHITLPAGHIRPDVWRRQQKYAEDILPPQFAELVNKTEVPFIQAITDVISPAAVLDSGRVLLIGDALAGVRPHTAMSTSQAAMDAMKLAEAVDGVIDGKGMEALKRWEEEVVRYARNLQGSGVRMGDRSQFGEHPMSG